MRAILWIVIACTIGDSQATKYDMIWNARSQQCRSRFGINVNVSLYGVRENSQNGWQGSVITISQFGLFPYILSNGTYVNGGLPQLANLTAHMATIQKNINSLIPDESFSGYGVLDYEEWYPIFEMNTWTPGLKVYYNASLQLTRQQHPDWSNSQVVARAKLDFDTSARALIMAVLNMALAMRPQSQWGMYLLPACYADNAMFCNKQDQLLNNKLNTIMGTANLLLPCIYLYTPDVIQNLYSVHSNLVEAVRVRTVLLSINPDLVVLPYARIRYAPREDYMTLKDTWLVFVLPVLLGADGIIIWEDDNIANNVANCTRTRDYLASTLGPLLMRTQAFTDNCRDFICLDSDSDCFGKNVSCSKPIPELATGDCRGLMADFLTFALECPNTVSLATNLISSALLSELKHVSFLATLLTTFIYLMY